MKIVEKKCPICGKDNNCGAKDPPGTCWCNHVQISKHLFSLIPQDKRRKACICLECVEKYKNTSSSYI